MVNPNGVKARANVGGYKVPDPDADWKKELGQDEESQILKKPGAAPGVAGTVGRAVGTAVGSLAGPAGAAVGGQVGQNYGQAAAAGAGVVKDVATGAAKGVVGGAMKGAAIGMSGGPAMAVGGAIGGATAGGIQGVKAGLLGLPENLRGLPDAASIADNRIGMPPPQAGSGPLSASIAKTATLPQSAAPAAPNVEALGQSSPFTATMTPKRRQQQLHDNMMTIRHQAGEAYRMLNAAPPDQRPALRMKYDQLLGEVHAMEGQMADLSRVARGPTQVATVEQTEAGRANLNRQFIGAEEDRQGGPVNTPAIEFSPYGNEQYEQSLKRAKEGDAAALAQANADEAPRAAADSYARQLAMTERENQMLGAKATGAGLQAQIAGNSPDLVRRQIEGALQNQDTQNKLAAATADVQVKRAEAERRIQSASVDEQAALQDPQMDRMFKELTGSYAKNAEQLLGAGARDEGAVNHYEQMVTRFEQSLQAMPPNLRELWRANAYNQIMSIPTPSGASRFGSALASATPIGLLWDMIAGNGPIMAQALPGSTTRRQMDATARLHRLLTGQGAAR